MAAATTIIAAAGLAVALGSGTAKAISGGKQKRAAKRAAKRFKRTELKNVQEGRSVVTTGAKLALEENARVAATTMKALESGGIRGVVGGSQGVQEASNKLTQRVGANLDQQQFALDSAERAEQVRIQQVKEARDNAELQAIQAQMNAGAQTQASGFGDVAQTGFAAASSGMFDASAPNTTPVNAKQTTAANPFAVDPNNALFTPAVNPITGQPYGI